MRTTTAVLLVAFAAIATTAVAVRPAGHVAADVPVCQDQTKYNSTLDKMLIASHDMPAQIVSVVAYVPIKTLVNYILEAKFVDWNPLFSTQATAPSDVKLCGPLDAVYSNGQFLAPTLAGQTITAPHYIAQMGCNTAGTTCAFGWWFTIEQQPPTGTEMIVYGRHTFTFIDNGDNTTTVESYERAAGTHVAKNSVPWSIALQESLLQAATGIVCLERVYQETGSLADDAVANACTKFLP